jgi:hypothetical protein
MSDREEVLALHKRLQTGWEEEKRNAVTIADFVRIGRARGFKPSWARAYYRARVGRPLSNHEKLEFYVAETRSAR